MRLARDSAAVRAEPTADMARQWQSRLMKGLRVPDGRYVGAFRGEPGLENVEVRVGASDGAPARHVAEHLERFLSTLAAALDALDARIPTGGIPRSEDELTAVLDVCAWAHAEWVRIHPFANGNGRTARLWANCVAMRYGLPPFVRLRPRPDADYGNAAARAMEGDWRATVGVFQRLYLDAVRDPRRTR
jgi:hypothetical protein